MKAHEPRQTRWWRQPLFHFLVAGAAIFALDAVRDSPETGGGKQIVVTSTQVERLADQWRLSWGRTPDDTELQSLVKNFVKEEIFYREALKLGLDVNDSVIRQRLGRKMEFLLSTELSLEDIDPVALQDYFDANVENYRLSAVYDFDQIFFNGGSTEDTAVRVADLRRQLAAGHSWNELGDAIGLPDSLNGASRAAVTRTFGAAFFEGLETLTTADWDGPITSGYGLHFVRVNNKVEARVPTLEEVRDDVANDWLAEENAVLRRKAFDELSATYDVRIELSSD